MPPPPDNDDILHEILIRLPAESLNRCRAVCKRWRAVIDEPPFVRARQHPPTNKSIIIIQPFSTTTSCYSLDLGGLSFSSNGDQTIAATPLDFSGDRMWSAVGACKGLLLTEKPLEIWNPLTQERLDLPAGHAAAAAAAFGLGYDYVTDDYKAVSILSTRQTDVYSLKSDSWRTITNCPRDPKGNGVFVCGALNWISSRAGCYEEDNKIIALDLGTEKHTLLQMPRPIRDYGQFRGYATTLDVLGGCLILCDSSRRRELDVWVMKDYGDEGSWVLLFSIEQLCRYDGCLRPLGFIMKLEDKTGLQVFLEEDCHDCFLFDVKTKTRKRVNIKGPAHLFSQKMFPGTKFCLRDNCGGARPKTSTTTSSVMSNNKNRGRRFVFCVKDISKAA